MNKHFLLDLNSEQKSAVISALGNHLVLAGAGSGKTRVLVTRIAYLVREFNISPNEILAVTFTNKAAREMKERLNLLLDLPVSHMWVGTFHGLCHRLLRKHYSLANLPEQFHIVDSDDQARIIKRVINELNIDIEQWPVKLAQSFINGRKDEGLRAKHILSSPNNQILLEIYLAYEKACLSSGVIDFAEIILRAHELLRDNQDLLNHYQSRFKAILVDEFQDTNTIQYAWIKLLSGNNASVMAVGDDDQSIYGWRGAKVENINKFTKDFKNTEVIRLEQNYRSTATILDAANVLITNNHTRMGKNLWTNGNTGESILLFGAFNELEEARFVADKVLKEIQEGCQLSEIAVLYRSNAQSRVIEEAFLHAGISYKIHGGMRFYERSEVKDTLAYLRLLLNRHDSDAFERVVNFPTRGIGDKSMDLVRQVALSHGISLWQAANRVVSQNILPQRANLALGKFLWLIDTLEKDGINLEIDEQINIIIHKSGLYEHFMKSKNTMAESKLQNLQELINAAKEFRYQEVEEDDDLPPMTAFLTHASLESGELQSDENEQHVHMMTIHSAKGLEFPIVFITGMEEGLFPSIRSKNDDIKMEEERRLCYVGLTRAMHKLVLTYSEVRRQYGREEYHRPSRFIRELPAELINEVRAKSSSYTSDSVAINDTGIALGTQVRHAKFGRGTVIAVEGSGPKSRVQVKFIDEGIKWLVLAYANLEI
ncbi:MAG: DNA helicase II [Legionellales bacterium RIFCSPHIGHO2_12_FULL_35_11]|nr:MAG: DNA helicase II [Legionellales bacterium RIFCSPHIGHO2_12_FULL_35_11]